MQDEPCGAHHDDIFKWDCAIRGPSDSPWEGGLYKIRVEFPENYPAAPTICTVDPPLFHPNVFPNGKVCLSILHPEGWNPSFGILEGSQRGRSRVAEGFANFQDSRERTAAGLAIDQVKILKIFGIGDNGSQKETFLFWTNRHPPRRLLDKLSNRCDGNRWPAGRTPSEHRAIAGEEPRGSTLGRTSMKMKG
ncbi:hypothetical protein M513_05899 [Trichuris suis]|uniref:UBC core domain-containing protein n=1 Tax=Trichuris suis TaxID=68888 RepID=A0A085M7J3_9BILA|nr:hypothetical protein M513_05899 [Trichuris suis]